MVVSQNYGEHVICLGLDLSISGGSVIEIKPLEQMREDSVHFLLFPCSIISSIAPATQQLLALLFGTWFRIVNHSEYNTMSAEAVAKSIAGSMFHTCSDDVQKVEEAVQILRILIDDFGVANMFGRKNIQYFADVTRTGIRVKEKYRYEYRYPQDDNVPCKFASSFLFFFDLFILFSVLLYNLTCNVCALIILLLCQIFTFVSLYCRHASCEGKLQVIRGILIFALYRRKASMSSLCAVV